VVALYGNASARFDPAHPPYAVFDWDNTCIMNDCEEALFMHQIEHLAFMLTPDELAGILRLNVPPGPFKAVAEYMTQDGGVVTLDDLAYDVEQAYRWLYTEKADGKSLAEIHSSPQFHAFRAKLYFMYEAICATHPIEIGYQWIIAFFANMTPAQLQALAAASNARGLGDGLRKVTYASPRSLPGRAGVIAVSHFHGLRVNEDMRALMHTLRANGIDVFVSTASLDDVVRTFASDPDVGFAVPPENVIGLRLEISGGKYTPARRSGWHFNWGPGKTMGIRAVLGARGDPLMVFGDSDGDAWMLSDFAGTQLGVIVNRLKGGHIGNLCRKAAASLGDPAARFVMQGRNEHTGIATADERSIKYGTTQRQLLV
jgi:phosphoserine phosphatase